MSEAASAAEDRARADLYGLLARLLFVAPDAGALAALAGAGAAWQQAAGEQSELAAAGLALARAAAAAEPAAVRDEFHALFLGVGKPEVLPYGSFYLAGFMNEKPLARLRDDLAAAGLARPESVSEPEDHIAALCETLRVLILDEESSEAQRLERQAQMYTRHLQPWAATFCEALRSAPHADFYAHVADFARAFLDLEARAFAMEATS